MEIKLKFKSNKIHLESTDYRHKWEVNQIKKRCTYHKTIEY